MFLSKIEQANLEIRQGAERHRERLTPQHAAAAAALAAAQGEPLDGDAREAEPDVTKAFRDAYAPPASYPEPACVDPEGFRRGPVPGQGAPSPADGPARSFPLPSYPRPPLPGASASFSRPPASQTGDCP